MAWPKGRRRTKSETPARDIGPEVAPVLGHPAQPESTLAACPPVFMPDPHGMTGREEELAADNRRRFAERQTANRVQMLCYIRGDFVPRDLRVHWDMRNKPIVDRVKAAMRKDRATPDKAEAYLDAELARH